MLRNRGLALSAVTGVALLTAAGASAAEANTHSGPTAHAAATSILGGGSTFAAPIYQQWSSMIPGLQVTFQPTGSGQGVSDLLAGTTAFAGSDPFVPPRMGVTGSKQGKGSPLLNFPVGFGAITVSYNLPGVRSGLHLTGPVIANIYLHRITTWNAPAIARLNPGRNLPNTPITVVHRNDSSGTTALFTSFLNDYSPAWKRQVGSDKEVKWPTGTGAKGNPGVAAAVKQRTGSIGYVEQAYALANHFTFAAVRNRRGRYVLPSLAATSAAAVGVKVGAGLNINVINAPGARAYPITGQTFLVTYRDMCKAGIQKSTAQGVVKFLNYAMHGGQSVLTRLNYAPLPSPIRSRAIRQLNQLQCLGRRLG